MALLVVVGKVPLAELAQNFVNTLPVIEAFVQGRRPPYIAKVYRPPVSELARNATALGSISLWYPK